MECDQFRAWNMHVLTDSANAVKLVCYYINVTSWNNLAFWKHQHEVSWQILQWSVMYIDCVFGIKYIQLKSLILASNIILQLNNGIKHRKIILFEVLEIQWLINAYIMNWWMYIRSLSDVNSMKECTTIGVTFGIYLLC